MLLCCPRLHWPCLLSHLVPAIRLYARVQSLATLCLWNCFSNLQYNHVHVRSHLFSPRFRYWCSHFYLFACVHKPALLSHCKQIPVHVSISSRSPSLSIITISTTTSMTCMSCHDRSTQAGWLPRLTLSAEPADITSRGSNVLLALA